MLIFRGVICLLFPNRRTSKKASFGLLPPRFPHYNYRLRYIAGPIFRAHELLVSVGFRPYEALVFGWEKSDISQMLYAWNLYSMSILTCALNLWCNCKQWFLHGARSNLTCMICMAQPPSIGKKTPPSIPFSASPSIPPCLHHLNHSWPRSCFGALGASLSLAKAPQPQKKVQKNTDNLTGTRKNTNHSANTGKDGKDIEFRVLVKQGHVVYELLFSWSEMVEWEEIWGALFCTKKEVNIQVFTEIILPKKTSWRFKLFKRGPLHFAVIRYGAFGQTIPCQGWKVSRWAKNVSSLDELQTKLGCGFKYFLIFTFIWGRFRFWLIFFNWVETTN